MRILLVILLVAAALAPLPIVAGGAPQAIAQNAPSSGGDGHDCEHKKKKEPVTS